MRTHNVNFMIPSDGRYVNALDWCRDTFGPEFVTIERMFASRTKGRWAREYEDYAHSTVVFKFIDANDATLFKLTWC